MRSIVLLLRSLDTASGMTLVSPTTGPRAASGADAPLREPYFATVGFAAAAAADSFSAASISFLNVGRSAPPLIA